MMVWCMKLIFSLNFSFVSLDMQIFITSKTHIVTSLAFQKALNVISLVSIYFIKHKKEDIQFFILFLHSLKMLNLHICASFEWLSIISNQIYLLCGSNTFGLGGIFFRATPAVAWGLSFSGLIRRSTPVCRLLRLVRGWVGPIVTWIPTVHCNIHIIYT
jgi:hypothetical protein